MGRLEHVGPESLERDFARLVNDRHLRANDELAVAARSEASDPEDKSSYLSDPCEQILQALLDRFADRVTIEASLPADHALKETLERYGFVVPSWGSGMTIYERDLLG